MKEGWEYKKLGEVVDFCRGLTYGKQDEAISSDFCVLRSNNIDMESMSLFPISFGRMGIFRYLCTIQ